MREGRGYETMIAGSSLKTGTRMAGIMALVATTVAIWALSSAPARAATPTDVMFVFDTSGSMEGVLEEAVAEIQRVMTRIDTAVPEVDYGVAEVRDFGGSGYDGNEIDEPWLNEIERRHNLFPDVDYRLYA